MRVADLLLASAFLSLLHGEIAVSHGIASNDHE